LREGGARLEEVRKGKKAPGRNVLLVSPRKSSSRHGAKDAYYQKGREKETRWKKGNKSRLPSACSAVCADFKEPSWKRNAVEGKGGTREKKLGKGFHSGKALLSVSHSLRKGCSSPGSDVLSKKGETDCGGERRIRAKEGRGKKIIHLRGPSESRATLCHKRVEEKEEGKGIATNVHRAFSVVEIHLSMRRGSRLKKEAEGKSVSDRGARYTFLREGEKKAISQSRTEDPGQEVG